MSTTPQHPVLDLAAIDVDGEIREAEEAVAGDTRAGLFRKAAIGGGAVVGASFFGAMLPDLAMAKPSRKQDIRILKYALTLEYLEAEFYKRAVDEGGLSGQALAAAKLLANHEKTHVSAISGVLRDLNTRVPKKPSFDFKDTNKGDQFLPTAFVLENLGVRAYLGQAVRIKRQAILRAAASIVTIEARHAAAIAVLLNADNAFESDGDSITPNGAFDRGRGMKKVLNAVEETGYIQNS